MNCPRWFKYFNADKEIKHGDLCVLTKDGKVKKATYKERMKDPRLVFIANKNENT